MPDFAKKIAARSAFRAALRVALVAVVAAVSMAASCGETPAENSTGHAPPPPKPAFREPFVDGEFMVFTGYAFGQTPQEALANSQTNAKQQAADKINASVYSLDITAARARYSTAWGSAEDSLSESFDSQVSAAIFKNWTWRTPSDPYRDAHGQFLVAAPGVVPLAELQKTPAQVAADFRAFAREFKAGGDFAAAAVAYEKSLSLARDWHTLLEMAQLFRMGSNWRRGWHAHWNQILDLLDDAENLAGDDADARESIATERARVVRDMEQLQQSDWHHAADLPASGDAIFANLRAQLFRVPSPAPLDAYIGFFCERADHSRVPVLTPEFTVTPGNQPGRYFDGDAIKVYVRPLADALAAVFVRDHTGTMVFQAPRHSRELTALAAGQPAEIPAGELWSQIVAVPGLDGIGGTWDEFIVILACPNSPAATLLSRIVAAMSPIDPAKLGPGVSGFTGPQAELFARELELLAGPAQIPAIVQSRENRPLPATRAFTEVPATMPDDLPATLHTGTDILVAMRRFLHKK